MLLPVLRRAILPFLLLASCGAEDAAPRSDGGTGASAGTAGDAAATGGSAGQTGDASAGSGGGGAAGASGGGGDPDAAITDGDGDGLDDGFEAQVASAYFPYYSVAPDDKCPRHGVLFRVSPHPQDTTKLMIWYVVLFEKDCGAGGHPGDDEVFGAIVDPAQPPPAGLLALRAISHQGTLCERITTCGVLPGCKPCTTASKGGAAFPVVFTSVNKHGGYVFENECDTNFICDFGGCTLNPTPSAPPMVNAGEPDKPLVNDLTSQGFINAGEGWTEPSLMNFDPWGGKDFGSAGNVTDDLQDAAFVVSPSGC